MRRFQSGTTSLDAELDEQPDRSESRYVRSSGGLPPATRRNGRGCYDKGRGKGHRRAPPWVASTAEPPSSTGWFPTWEASRNEQRELQTAFAASVRMDGRHGSALLIDTGSPSNICGSEWSREMTAECSRAGVNGPQYAQRDRPLTCSGIGKGSQQADHDVTHTISVGDGRWGTYTAPELPNSRVPALWGQRSMKEKRALIDTFTGRIYLVAPGGYELKLSPGSVQHDLVESSAGHLMLPCSQFKVPMRRNEEAMSYIVGEHFHEVVENHSSGGLPPAPVSSDARGAVLRDDDPMKEFNSLVNRAHDELDMLVASARSKRQD